jgi:hypothetical protein
MANSLAVHSVGASLIVYLRNTYPDSLREQFPCDFRLLMGAELAGETADMPTSRWCCTGWLSMNRRTTIRATRTERRKREATCC